MKHIHKSHPDHHYIHITKKPNLLITIETPRLSIRSIVPEDEKDLAELLKDPVVVEKANNGEAFPDDFIKNKLKLWSDHNPFSVYAIFEKDSKELIGIITFGSPDTETLYVGCALHSTFRGQRYASEAADAIQSLVSKLLIQGYKPHFKDATYVKPLKELKAKVQIDNVPSRKLLEGLGFKIKSTFFEDHHMKYGLSVSANKLRNRYAQFFTHRDQKLYQKEMLRLMDEEVDVTAVEMKNSVFGKRK